ncbi:uncharacterized protein LOC117177469 [Belonocnema kinseyi]|uniref:uncharacterized protein LOC117177469 n=1 Tax=Belonocnema kinseyi TaxID=2817044 RepID=UPI00143D380A|nr:uncharacterized protein LOC117177469 [Belonocnema kinseyi]
MIGKLLFAFILIVAALFPAIKTERKLTTWGFIKCFTICRKSEIDRICAYSYGSFVTFGRKTYECLKRHCGRGGKYLHDGPCNTQSIYVLQNSASSAPRNEGSLVAMAA